MEVWRTAVVASGLMLLGNSAIAQTSLRVTAGWGVDTTGAVAWTDVSAAGDIREVFRRWAEYLRSNPRQQAPTRLWSSADQGRWPHYDLTASIAYQGRPAGATLVDMVHEIGGIAAVKELLKSGRSTVELQHALTRILAADRPEVSAGWRARALALGG